MSASSQVVSKQVLRSVSTLNLPSMSSDMIDTADRLVSHLKTSRNGSEPPVCAIDTEADSLHRYRESLCLDPVRRPRRVAC